MSDDPVHRFSAAGQASSEHTEVTESRISNPESLGVVPIRGMSLSAALRSLRPRTQLLLGSAPLRQLVQGAIEAPSLARWATSAAQAKQQAKDEDHTRHAVSPADPACRPAGGACPRLTAAPHHPPPAAPEQAALQELAAWLPRARPLGGEVEMRGWAARQVGGGVRRRRPGCRAPHLPPAPRRPWTPSVHLMPPARPPCRACGPSEKSPISALPSWRSSRSS